MRIVEILFKDLQIGWGLVILISIIFIIRLYLPQFIDGAVISQIFKKEKGEEPNIGDSIGSGLYHSWGIIKINALLEVFQLSTVMTAWLFIFRSNDDLLWIVTPVCVVIGSIGLILHYFSLFAKPILIEKGVSVMEALAQSTKLTLLNIKHSFILFFFILFISARLFFNVFIILALPIIISFLISYLAIKLSIVATLIITGVISVLFLYFIVRFFASIDVLFLSVWVMLYKEIENKNV
ncbi:MAG: hypothetical protein U9Q15_02675 [Patescibacteria group bacterium]|nr:hypothetical protein [Patescibacteria group bacterium]